MSSRRTLILVGAIAIGAVAAFSLLNYIRGVEERAKPNPVEVWVVTQPVPRGTSFAQAQGALTKKTIPAEFRPATFVADPRALENKVAVANLAPDQILVRDMFVNPEVATTSYRNRISGDNVAMAISLDSVRGVGGLLQPDDEVNILVTVPGTAGASSDGENPTGNVIDPNASPFTQTARYLFEKVRILAIGNQVRAVAGQGVNQNAATDPSTGGGMIIFELPAEAAQLLASIDPSYLYLTLVPEGWQPRPLGPLTLEDLQGLLPAEDPGKLTPYGPEGDQRLSAARSADPAGN